MAGAPSKYTPELFDKICDTIAQSDLGLVYICEHNGLSAKTFYEWIKDDVELRNKYARARELQADFLADQILNIADDGSNDFMKIVKGDMEYNVEDKEVTNRSRLRVDARKWIASKLAPKKYGDKMDVKAELTGELSVKQITGMEIK